MIFVLWLRMCAWASIAGGAHFLAEGHAGLTGYTYNAVEYIALFTAIVHAFVLAVARLDALNAAARKRAQFGAKP